MLPSSIKDDLYASNNQMADNNITDADGVPDVEGDPVSGQGVQVEHAEGDGGRPDNNLKYKYNELY